MWESPNENDYSYSQYDPYLYSLDAHNRCKKCGRIIAYTAGKLCDKCKPTWFERVWKSIFRRDE